MPTIQSTKHFTCRQAHPTPLPILLFKARALTLLHLLLFKKRSPLLLAFFLPRFAEFFPQVEQNIP